MKKFYVLSMLVFTLFSCTSDDTDPVDEDAVDDGPPPTEANAVQLQSDPTFW